MCTVRPSIRPLGQPDDEADEWEELIASGVVDDDEVKAYGKSEGDVSALDGSETVAAKCLPCPRQPSKEEIAKHNVNHLPYRSWCPHCLAARRANASHRTSRRHSGRSVPLFCADYAFVRRQDEDLQTLLVG